MLMFFNSYRVALILSLAAVQFFVMSCSSDGGGDDSPGDQMMVVPPPGDGHDLRIFDATVSDNTLSPGQSFTLSVEVVNRRGRSPPTTLRYYLLSHGVASVIVVGIDSIPALGPDEISSQSITLMAPQTPGAHVYYACVDAELGELEVLDNCIYDPDDLLGIIAGPTFVTVSEPSGGDGPVPAEPPPGDGHDLVVRDPTVSDNTLSPGQSFTLSVEVFNNQGRSPPTTLRYSRSSRAPLASGIVVGIDSIPALGPAEISSQSIIFMAPQTLGTYSYSACVDAELGEIDFINNCGAILVRVSASSGGDSPGPATPYDLTVRDLTVSDDTLSPGQSFTLSVEVVNSQGRSPPTTLRYTRLGLGILTVAVDVSFRIVGRDSVPALGPDETSSQSITLTAPQTPGTYVYGARVDTDVGELNVMNNSDSDLGEGEVVVSDSSGGDGAVRAPSVSP